MLVMLVPIWAEFILESSRIRYS